MSLISEQIKAVKWGHYLLDDILKGKEFTAKELKERARAVRRHYPVPIEIEWWEKWLVVGKDKIESKWKRWK